MADTVDLATVPFTDTTLKRLIGTPTIPKRWKSFPDALAGVLYGRELGLSPMHSLNLLHIINGKVGMEGKALLALIQSRGHLVIPVEMSAEGVTLKALRRDPYTHEMIDSGDYSFTAADASNAGLWEQDTYQDYPVDMLYWRAVSRVAKFAFSDVTTGLLLPEELGAVVEVDDMTAATAALESALDAEVIIDATVDEDE